LPKETQKALGPPDTKDRVWANATEFARYPLYSTTGQTEEKTEVTRLTASEVNLLAAQSEYAVRQNEKLFREVLCPGGMSGLLCRHSR